VAGVIANRKIPCPVTGRGFFEMIQRTIPIRIIKTGKSLTQQEVLNRIGK
jgi:hypothetical protein